MSTLFAALIAAAISGIALGALTRSRGLPFDRPNARSLHRGAVRRGGGVAIWLGWCAGTLWLPGFQPWLLPLAAVVIISFFDDYHGIAAPWRLLVHLAAAVAWAGCALTDVTNINYYVTDVGAYRAALKDLGVQYREVFGTHYPASTLVAVTDLFDPEALIEIDCTAMVPEPAPKDR